MIATTELRGNALVGQSGGPTAAINATLAGVISAVLTAGAGKIRTLYGMRHGIEGALADDLIDLSARFSGVSGVKDLRRLRATPAAALGSCRKKMADPDRDATDYRRLLEIFRKHDIRYFFYIGGNDSMDTADKMSRWFASSGWEMRVIGIPKTIDNDLCGTDHTPGFGSAAKYVATAVKEMTYDTAVYTVKCVTIVEIMGRDAGWLAASSACAGLTSDAGAPDIICLPEKPFDEAAFLQKIQETWKTHPNVIACVSEGIRDASGEYVGAGCQSGATDVFGHKYLAGAGKYLEGLCKQKLGCKVRSVELNLPQRCAGHITSACDLRESVAVGKAAVKLALSGQTGVMPSFRRVSDNPYRVRIESCPLSVAANNARSVPDAYITKDGMGVTPAFLTYARPLIAGETAHEFKNGVPVYFHF